MLTSVLTTLLLSLAPASPARTERLIRIEVPEHDAVYRLNRQVEIGIIDAQPDHVTAIADDQAVVQLRGLGYRVTVLVEDYAGRLALELVEYHNYAQVCSIMRATAAACPGIARLETLGKSYSDSAILALRITEAPQTDAGRPRVRLVGCHHGNEKISTEVTLAFLQYLCANYGSDPVVTELVDTRETWVVPILNPDGHISNSRGNGSGRDLNRDYGYEWEVYSEPFSQPEPRALRTNSENHIPTLEFAYHSTASYVNYLWDNHPVQPADSDWVQALSERYADSTYGSTLTRLDTTNGYRWYEVHGSCQDHTFGIYGAPAWTIETRQPSTRPKIDSICVANRRALLDMLRLAGWGISGRVYDSLTGSPLFARVEFLSPRRWPAFTNSACGDFHKMLAPGSYTVRVTVNGYVPKTLSGVEVPDTGRAFLDVPMARPLAEPWLHAQKVVTVKRIDDNHLYSNWVYEALGAPDSVYYTVGPNQSSVVFDLDPYEPARDRVGNDITVHATGSYSLAAGNNWQGPWHGLGNASGTASFDLASVSLDSTRYLRLVSNGNALLDGTSYLGRERSGVAEHGPGLFIPDLAVSPTLAARSVRIRFTAPAVARPRLLVLDAAGRTVRRLEPRAIGNWQLAIPNLQFELDWNLDDDNGRPVPAGVYFCRLSGQGVTAGRKVVVER